MIKTYNTNSTKGWLPKVISFGDLVYMEATYFKTESIFRICIIQKNDISDSHQNFKVYFFNQNTRIVSFFEINP